MKQKNRKLDDNGYPPVQRNEVYAEVFEQAEHFKKYAEQEKLLPKEI